MDKYQFSYQRSPKTELPETIQKLVQAAEEATARAYAPYSKFLVGASLLMEDGTMRTGANQENASYPAGICAEKAALASLDLNKKNNKVKAIAVTYRNGNDAGIPVAPCGICRQSILEVQLAQGAPIAVYMTGPDGDTIFVEDASLLLPFFFSGSNLNG